MISESGHGQVLGLSSSNRPRFKGSRQGLVLGSEFFEEHVLLQADPVLSIYWDDRHFESTSNSQINPGCSAIVETQHPAEALGVRHATCPSLRVEGFGSETELLKIP